MSSSNADFEKIKARIAKLLALATSSNENEAATAMKMAAKLMFKHGLSESEFKSKAELLDATYQTQFVIIPRWVIIIALGISKPLGVHVAYSHGLRATKFQTATKGVLYLAGSDSDIELFKYTFEVLCRLVKKEADQKLSGLVALSTADRRMYVKSYRIGMSKGVIEGLQKNFDEEFTKESEKATGTSLVLVNRHSVAREYALTLRKMSTVKTAPCFIDKGAFNEGLTDASRVAVNAGIN